MDADRVQQVIAAGDELWEAFRRHRGTGFHPFVPADYTAAAVELARLAQDQPGGTFLELGSGVGTIAILADLAGFESYGIEIDPWLVDAAAQLAEEVGSDATFVEGSFIPPDLDVDARLLDADFLPTRLDGADAYRELGLDLADFDVIYGFPWPEEELLLWDMVRRGARPGCVYLTYSGTEGYRTLSVTGDDGEAAERAPDAPPEDAQARDSETGAYEAGDYDVGDYGPEDHGEEWPP